jgi:hypothetical protein
MPKKGRMWGVEDLSIEELLIEIYMEQVLEGLISQGQMSTYALDFLVIFACKVGVEMQTFQCNGASIIRHFVYVSESSKCHRVFGEKLDPFYHPG